MDEPINLMQRAAQDLCAAETALRQAYLMFRLVEEDLALSGKETFLLAQAAMVVMDRAADQAGAACDFFSEGECHG